MQPAPSPHGTHLYYQGNLFISTSSRDSSWTPCSTVMYNPLQWIPRTQTQEESLSSGSGDPFAYCSTCTSSIFLFSSPRIFLMTMGVGGLAPQQTGWDSPLHQGLEPTPQQTGWNSPLHQGLELSPSDLLGWQEAVTYKGTESRNIAGGRLSHMTLGWSTSGQRPPLLLPMIALGAQVS